MPAKKLSPRKQMAKKEEDMFGDKHVHHLPGNIHFDPADIGEYGKIKHKQTNKSKATPKYGASLKHRCKTKKR